MDCEMFDQHVMDALYDELDELTHAALKRHMEGCNRCASAFAGLRATRDVGILPLEEPADDLEARILEAVAVAQRKTPLRRKALRALAWAGSHAMRPQLAMAALFVLVIGSSLLLLRAKPGTVGVAPVRVTERGVPAPEQPEQAQEAITPEPAVAAAPTAPPAEGAELKKGEDPAKEKAVAERAGDAKADGASAALEEAQAVQKQSGCAAALAKLDEVGTKYPGTAAAHTAMWEAARCYKSAGDEAKARELLLTLRSVDDYKEQAEQELAGVENNAMTQNAAPAAAGRPAAAAPARAAAKPAAAPVPAAPQPAPPNAAPAGQGLSAPKRSDAFY
jgi:hypothetical protein